MIFLFYFFSPLFIYLKNRNLLEYALIMSLIPALLIGRPIFSENNVLWSFYFLPPYLLGMILMLRPSNYQVLKKYSFTMLIGVVVGYLSIFMNRPVITPVNTSLDLLLKMTFFVILFSFSKQYLLIKNRWLNLFARISFYLFFIHGYFVALFRLINLKIFNIEITGIWALAISFCSVMMLSIGSFIFIKFILKDRSKSLIGI